MEFCRKEIKPMWAAWLEDKTPTGGIKVPHKIYVPIEESGEVLFNVRVREKPLDGGLCVGELTFDRNLNQFITHFFEEDSSASPTKLKSE